MNELRKLSAYSDLQPLLEGHINYALIDKKTNIQKGDVILLEVIPRGYRSDSTYEKVKVKFVDYNINQHLVVTIEFLNRNVISKQENETEF